MINYWCKWALAIYGWKYLWSWMKFEVGKTLTAFWNSDSSNQDALLEYLDISPDDIIKVQWKSDKYHPAYIIAFDHRTKNIVVSIRGTMSVYDLITDANNKNEKFMDGKVHSGMRRAANNIYRDVVGIMLDKRKDKDYSSYGFRFVGHSLGAGVASIITHMFLDNYTDHIGKTKTYCFGCPPIFSKNIAEKWENNIVTVVNNKDVIPRLSIGDQLYLPGLILHYIKTDSGKTYIGRNKEYFVTESLITTSFREHMPNKYYEITQILC